MKNINSKKKSVSDVTSPELEFLKAINAAMSKYYRDAHSLAIKRGIQAAKAHKNNETNK